MGEIVGASLAPPQLLVLRQRTSSLSKGGHWSPLLLQPVCRSHVSCARGQYQKRTQWHQIEVGMAPHLLSVARPSQPQCSACSEVLDITAVLDHNVARGLVVRAACMLNTDRHGRIGKHTAVNTHTNVNAAH